MGLGNRSVAEWAAGWLAWLRRCQPSRAEDFLVVERSGPGGAPSSICGGNRANRGRGLVLGFRGKSVPRGRKARRCRVRVVRAGGRSIVAMSLIDPGNEEEGFVQDIHVGQ